MSISAVFLRIMNTLDKTNSTITISVNLLPFQNKFFEKALSIKRINDVIVQNIWIDIICLAIGLICFDANININGIITFNGGKTVTNNEDILIILSQT